MPFVLVAPLFMASLAPDAVSPEDRSGPSREARCKIDQNPVVQCRFTPLFGDGSFNIELPEGRELRIVVDGERGWLFIPVSAEQRVRILTGYHRDKGDRACWVTDDPRDAFLPGPPDSICVYN